jgi:hypothetical protein
LSWQWRTQQAHDRCQGQWNQQRFAMKAPHRAKG